MAKNRPELMRELGSRLRAVRMKVGLSQEAIGKALGLKQPWGHSYVGRLERGAMGDVGFGVVVRYLEACSEPVAKLSLRDGFAFTLELAQAGASGEAEQGLIVVEDAEDRKRQEQVEREKAKTRYEKRASRKAQDAHLIALLWTEVQSAIVPLLPPGQVHLVAAYLNGVRRFYRAWKLIRREAKGIDPTPLVRSAFDRVEQEGISQRLNPEAVHKMREVIFERLMRTSG